jgi:hypothetical protein
MTLASFVGLLTATAAVPGAESCATFAWIATDVRASSNSIGWHREV